MISTMFPQQVWKTALTANDSSAKEQVGILRVEYDSTYGVRGYRDMQAAADTTVANGTVLTYSDTYKFTATSDISDAGINQVAGVGTGAITAEYYGWVQCFGYHATVLTDAGDDIADGDSVIVHASTNGVADTTASGTASVSKPLGIAVAADVDADDTVATQLDCMF